MIFQLGYTIRFRDKVKGPCGLISYPSSMRDHCFFKPHDDNIEHTDGWACVIRERFGNSKLIQYQNVSADPPVHAPPSHNLVDEPHWAVGCYNRLMHGTMVKPLNQYESCIHVVRHFYLSVPELNCVIALDCDMLQHILQLHMFKRDMWFHTIQDL